MADAYTASGTRVYIGPTQATEPANSTAYAALSWQEIALVEDAGEYGDSATTVTAAALGDGRIRKAKGANDAGDVTLVVFPKESDVGQQNLIAAQGTNLYYPFKYELPNKLTGGGTNGLDYFLALVTTRRTRVGTNDNIVRRTFTLAITTKITNVAAT